MAAPSPEAPIAPRLLLTGGAGFIGSALARALSRGGWEVVVLDAFTYAGRREHLEGVGCEILRGDVADPGAVRAAVGGCAAVVHAAAESHVERSLAASGALVRTNVEGTRVVLGEAARAGVGRFLLLSTDEVFGEAPDGVAFAPDAPIRPGNPYAATKAGAEAMVHAWRHTWGYPAAIARCTNAYGPRQHPEKAVPDWAIAALEGRPVPVQGDGEAVRDWLFVEDLARGVSRALERWRPAATWHFAGRQPLANQEMAARVAAACGGGALVSIAARQGQDRRYAIDDRETRAELGWEPVVSLDEGLAATAAWYREHRTLWS